MISESAFKLAAARIGCKVAAIKAVAEVESSGNGFVDNLPVILFEPHVFYRELKARGFNADIVAKNPYTKTLCYRNWKTYPYPTGKNLSERNYKNHVKLQQAVIINKDAGLSSASYGKFQIMGFNWAKCGCKTLQEFINAMWKSEDEHLRLFVNFIIKSGLDDELRQLRFGAFADIYNGKYHENYDVKMWRAYNKFNQ